MTTPNIEDLIERLHNSRSCDELCDEAAAALQSQAERIAYLEADRNLEKKMRKDADEYAETLRAQLVEIEKTEPDIYVHQDGLQVWGAKNNAALGNNPNFTAYFTHPMPADVTDLVEALEQMIACHDEPTCPAIDVARTALSKYKGVR